MKHDLNNKVVLIAGGAKNLGGLIARDLAKNGAKGVVVHYNSDATRADAEKTVSDIQAMGVQAYATQGDLTQAAAVTHLFDEAVRQMGGIDIAINTTGVVIKKPILDVSEADYDQSFAVNSKAAFFFIQQAGRTLNEGGKIVTIVSSLLAAYHASAAALSGYSKTGLTDIADIAPIVKFLVTEGWWMTGQTIFANGGYTTR